MFFLKKVAEHILNDGISKLGELTIVFPSKRAGLYFQEELKVLVREQGFNATWLPKIKAIDEFLLSFSNSLIPEQLDLIFVLYKSYLKIYYDKSINAITKEDDIVSFDKFYPFGEMLLKDFQEIDSYLANPDQIFFDLTLLERIKEQDLDTFLQYEAVKRFVENFSKLSDSDPKERFSFFWNRLNPFYKDFHQALDLKNWSYNGKEYRRVHTLLKNEKLELNNTVCFAGFNALTVAEEKIINELLKTSKCKIFWKYDDVFLGKKTNEGSRFLREYISKWSKYDNSIVIKSPNASFEKNLNIVNTSSQIAQVKFVAEKLTKLPTIDIPQTLVVLSDESLLNPFLDSVPSNIEKLNVTMGFPLRNSNFWSFLMALFKIISTKKDGEIYHRWGQMFLESSVISTRYPVEYREIIDEINLQGEVYINREFLISFKSELSEILIDIVKYDFIKSISFVRFLNELLTKIINDALSENDIISYFHFKKQLNRLETILIENEELASHLNLEFTIRTITQLVQSTKIPYEGLPLEGLQVMGPLEIRVLDFKNVFFLSMNEGIYPNGGQRTSLLPYSLRKAFDLPNFETQESIYAHHFHALMQNASQVTGIYFTKEGAVGGSEKSRFLTQLIYENDEYLNLKIQENIVSYSVGEKKSKEISIPNNDIIINELIDKYNLEDKYLSPTAIMTFLECSLKYYYRYVAGVRESNFLNEDLEHVDIGKIIHKALELMFEENRVIDLKLQKLLLSKVDHYINNALKDPEVDIKNQKGYNHYIIKGAREYVKKYLENSIDELPLENIGVEELLTLNFPMHLSSIKLGGNIDLITLSNGSITLIDYKTGKMPLKVSFPNDFDVYRKDINGYKNQFQVMFYAYLFNQTKKHKDFKVELRYLMSNKSLGRKSMSDEEISLFGNFLSNIISKIFDKEISFSQTEDVEKCLYCPFKLICNR